MDPPDFLSPRPSLGFTPKQPPSKPAWTAPSSTASLPDLLQCLESTPTPCLAFPGQVERLVYSRLGAVVGLSTGQVAAAEFLPDPCAQAMEGEGHKERVSCLAVAGKLCVSGSRDNTLKVWNIEEKQLVGTLSGHTAAVTCLCVTSNGSYCLSGSRDNSVRLWSLETRKLVAVLAGHTSIITCLALVNDGQCCVSGSFDNSLRVWAVDERREVGRLLGHSYSVYCLAVAGRLCVSGSADNTLRVWNVDRCKELGCLTGHKSYIRAVVLTVDASKAVSGSGDCTVRVWDLNCFSPVAVFAGHYSFITALLLTADEEMCISAASDGLVKVWSLTELREVATLTGHAHWVNCLALSPDQAHCVSGSADSTLRQWSLEPRVHLCDFSAGCAPPSAESVPKTRGKESCTSEDEVTCVAAAGDLFLSGSSDSSLKLWSGTERKLVAEFVGHKGGITCLAVCPSDQVFVSGSTDFTLRLWDMEKASEVAVFVGHTERVNCVGITPNGAFCISGSADSSLILWSLTDLCQISTLTGHTDWIDCLVISADGRYCASGARDLSVRLWEVEEAEAAAVFEGHTADIYCLAFAPKRDMLVSGSADNLVKVWSLSTRMELATLRGHTDWIYCMAITAEGDYLVTGAADHSVRLWSLKKFKPVAVLLGHSAEVSAVYITPNGQYCVSGGYDCSLKLWSLQERREVGELKGHSKEVICAAPVLGGQWCVSGAADNSLRLQPLPLPHTSPASSLFVANLASFRAGHSVPAVLSKALLPQRINCLHISAYYGHWERLQEALESRIPVLRGVFGSPLTIALSQVWPKCAETLLTYFTQVAQAAGTDKVWPVFEAIEDDLATLLRLRSSLLLPFLQVLVRPSGQLPLPEFLAANYPQTRLVKQRYIPPNMFGAAPSTLEDCNPVQFRISLIKRNNTVGSRDSMQLLSSLSSCRVKGAVKTHYAKELVEEKWRVFFPLTLLTAFLYAGLVGVGVGVLVREDSYWLRCIYAGLNAAFLLFELLAVVLLGPAQVATPWTFLNLSQSLCSLLWLLESNFCLVAFVLTFLRGFGLFRIFAATRIHVHMAFSVLGEASSFLVILAYATLCLLTLPMTLGEEATAWYWDVTGEFEYSVAITVAIAVTIGVLLHLLTAVVGAAYENTQTIMEEEDLKTRLQLILTYESFLVWRRTAGCKRALVICEVPKTQEVLGE